MVNKKGLKRHQATRKCKHRHLSLPMDANHALPIEDNLEVQEETKMLNTKALLVQEWAQLVGYEIMDAIISPNIDDSDMLCPPTDASAAPGIDSVDDKIHGVVYHQSPSSSVHSSQEVPTTATREETKNQALPLPPVTQGSPVNHCPCTPHAIYRSCMRLRQHLDEASNLGNPYRVCTCFKDYSFRLLRNYMVARTCPLIVEHLEDMVSVTSPLQVVT